MDKQSKIIEEFLGFVPCKEGLSGEAVATTIKEFLPELNLPIGDCRGQGYDGAGNMGGRLSVAAKIQEAKKKAVYVHCNFHLCVTACCKEQLVQNMMDHVCIATEFFSFSPKRFNLLVKTIDISYTLDSAPHIVGRRKLKPEHRRWSFPQSRHKA